MCVGSAGRGGVVNGPSAPWGARGATITAGSAWIPRPPDSSTIGGGRVPRVTVSRQAAGEIAKLAVIWGGGGGRLRQEEVVDRIFDEWRELKADASTARA
jgi:hypothetical protein